MSRPRPLAVHQHALARWLLKDGAANAPHVASASSRSPRDRLRLYTDGYRLRLVEVLGNDMPVLRSHAGETRFDALVRRYLADEPSTAPSVRHFGRHFPRWLQAHAALPLLADLASFEWRQGEVFDATDAISCAFDDVASLPASAWPALRMVLHPALRRVRLHSNAATLVDAHARGLPLPPLQACDANDWLLWRADFDVHWRRLPDDEAGALDAVARGDAFADWCAQLSSAQPALRAASLLKRWLADGLVTACVTTPTLSS